MQARRSASAARGSARAGRKASVKQTARIVRKTSSNGWDLRWPESKGLLAAIF
jgi:hypothetical protein